MSRSRLYTIMLVSCVAGMAWVGLSFQQENDPTTKVGFCPVKEISGYPCPACGSTRSVTSLMQGDFSKAWTWNPFGFIIFIIMTVSPVWIIMDLMRSRNSFHRFYLQTESIFRHKWISIPAILLVLANWIWNFIKLV